MKYRRLDHFLFLQAGLALLQEIMEVNRRLVETMVSICSEDVGPSEVTTGTIVMCSYAPVALCDTFQALYKSGHVVSLSKLVLLLVFPQLFIMYLMFDAVTDSTVTLTSP